MVGPPLLDRIFRIKCRKVSADDLLRAISFHALRAWIPGAYVAFAVEHEDCIVLRAVNQIIEFLGLSPSAFSILEDGNQAGHFGPQDLGIEWPGQIVDSTELVDAFGSRAAFIR